MGKRQSPAEIKLLNINIKLSKSEKKKLTRSGKDENNAMADMTDGKCKSRKL